MIRKLSLSLSLTHTQGMQGMVHVDRRHSRVKTLLHGVRTYRCLRRHKIRKSARSLRFRFPRFYLSPFLPFFSLFLHVRSTLSPPFWQTILPETGATFNTGVRLPERSCEISVKLGGQARALQSTFEIVHRPLTIVVVVLLRAHHPNDCPLLSV